MRFSLPKLDPRGIARENPVGVAVQGRTLAVVRVADGRVDRSHSLSLVDDSSGGVRDAEKSTDQAMVDALAASIQRGDVPIKSVVLALSPGDVEYRNLRLPPMEAGEQSEAVRWEMADRLGTDVQTYIAKGMLAGSIRQGGEERDELIGMAVNRSRLERLTDALVGAGIEPVAFEPASISLARLAARSVSGASAVDGTTLLVHVGESHSEIVAQHGESIQLIKTVDIAMHRLRDAVAAEFGCSPARAWAAVSGQEAPREIVDGLHQATLPELTLLAREVTLCVRYISVTFRGHRPDRAWSVCVPPIAAALSEALAAEAGIDCEPLPVPRGIDAARGHHFAVACGAAMRGAGTAWRVDVPHHTRREEGRNAEAA